jgi:flagellar hook-length control protein FliK
MFSGWLCRNRCMNSDLLIINNTFAGLGGTLSVQKRQGMGTKGKVISAVGDDRPTHLNCPETETTDNTAPDVTHSVSKKPAREFHHVLSEKTKAKDEQKSQNHAESKKQTGVSDQAKPAHNVPPAGATPCGHPNPFPAPGRPPVAAPSEVSLTELTDNLKNEKSSAVTGHAAKAAEIKLVPDVEKGQLGPKTVLPEQSNGLNGLRTVLPDAPDITPTQKAQPQTEQKGDETTPHSEAAVAAKMVTNKGNIKELAPEAPAGLNAKADAPEKKAADTTDSAASAPAKAPDVNTKKVVILNTNTDEKSAKTTPDAKKADAKPEGSANAASPTPPPPRAMNGHPATTPAYAQSGANRAKPAASVNPDGRSDAQQLSANSSDGSDKEPKHTGDESSDGTVPQKLKTDKLYVPTQQAKDQGQSAEPKNASQNFEQVLSHGSGHASASQQSTASAATVRTANQLGQNLPNDAAADVGKQILESIHGSLTRQRADQQITVRLNPPELGKVFIKLQERDSELTGVLAVSRTQTRAEIQHALPQIIRNLANCGIHVKRFDVMLSDQGRPGHETFGGQSPQNNGPYDHGSTNQNAWSDEANFTGLSDGSTNSGGYPNATEWQEAFFSDRSINVLI